MPKRRRLEEERPAQPAKKPRLRFDYDISLLSDEVILKILTYLPISDLATCQRLCHRLQRLAGDSELWKEKYYARWVRPRALRIPGLKDTIASSEAFRYSSKLAKWLNDRHLIQEGRRTDWKWQYRLRDNWWRGHCKVREVEVAVPPAPSVFVRIYRGVTFTADAKSGLRAWTTKKNPLLIASLPFGVDTKTGWPECRPTCLSIDTESSTNTDVCVGFVDGSFKIYRLNGGEFYSRYAHAPSSNGAISGIAMFYPYILTISDKKILSLYRFPSKDHICKHLLDPHLLASLQSSCVFAPISLSIRPSSGGLVATIAYALTRLTSGWSVGLQELRMTKDGETLDSRLTSSSEEEITAFHSIQDQDTTVSARAAASQPFVLHPESMARPTALSYSHPYLLASLPDNTLMTYLVTSNADKLEIAPGRRLWGHTSSVSGVRVGDRGKAVSVSRQGDEIRVWELEDLLSSSFQQRTSVCIQPENPDLGIIADAIRRRGDGLSLACGEMEVEQATWRKWIGFDEEQVVVLGERWRRQILSCYDFT
ncbi:hypothetical protein EPUS_08462 [Endocarpon pusillum Z07020]|uniref:F-box domain-containing protein n=1 Tax=Endocarpon pusillum (strain Z07020 / HMAS-L-300199) TaxID=1263415 RepID=U1GXD9_ENDPU|nr:uncharacterized protein EPUS_08462 [Endocarpon pusillum Z07020]ERF77158.1 hypothetical protein EPUS_08462 [Endocarpon pusillum Z07020]